MRLLLVVVVVAIGVVGVAALAKPVPVTAELVGQWSFGEDLGDGHGSYAQYDLRGDGTFTMSGYPPIEVHGNWALVERKPGKLHLRLTHQKMTVPPDRRVTDWSDVDDWGELSADGKTFVFNGKKLQRVAASAKPSPPTAPPPAP